MKYTVKQFKDGQWNITYDGGFSESVNIIEPINSYEDLFKIAHIKEVLDFHNCETKLSIPCLLGQRSDRRFNGNESFDLKVICNFINSLKFESVEILHPHSDVAPALLNNSLVTPPDRFIKKAVSDMTQRYKSRPVLVSPDAGAYKNTYRLSENLEMDMVASNKFRNAAGEPEIKILANVQGKDCLIVDDLADGGRTFKVLAERLKELGANNVCLYVTHAQFNYGFDELVTVIDHIYCTDSYRKIDKDFVTQYSFLDDL